MSVSQIVPNLTRGLPIKQRLCLIVAVDRNNGFAKDGHIPWRVLEDFNFFSDVTRRQSARGKNAIIMGKNTWKTLPDSSRGLKDRINIVISSTMTQEELESDNICKQEAYLHTTLEDALVKCVSTETIGDIYICGGRQIYTETVEKYRPDEFFVTRFDHDFGTDTFFDPSPFVLKDDYLCDMSHKFKLTDSISGASFDASFKKYCLREWTNSTNLEEEIYLHMLERLLNAGHFRQTRNAKTWSAFGKSLEFNLQKGFPLLTTKRVFFRGICEELFFFLKGDTNTNHLSDRGVKIWEPNTTREFLDKAGLQSYEVGDMGPMYGFNLCHFGAAYEGCQASYENKGLDQIAYCLNLLKTDPFSRRIIMTTYNPSVASEGVLYPCHGLLIMFGVEESGDSYSLSCLMTQRSADSLCGIPFNIASYALLVHLLTEILNNDPSYKGPRFIPGRLVMNFGDVHIYESHRTQAIRQILREPYAFPTLSFKRPIESLTDLSFDDVALTDYHHHPVIITKMVA